MVEFKFIEYGTDFGTRDMGMKLREKLLDTQRNDYRNKLIHDLGISIGVCFQINGW